MLSKNRKKDRVGKKEKELLHYIEFTMKKGISGKEIKNRLLEVGWSKDFIDEKISKIKNNIKKKRDNKKMEIKKPIKSIFEKNKNISKIMRAILPTWENMPFKKKDCLKEALFFLRQVEDERGFWVNEGKVLKSLENFSETLKTMKDETFFFHSNETKNDFVKWVEEVIEDKKLAKNISKTKTKQDFIKKVDQRIDHLKDLVEKHD